MQVDDSKLLDTEMIINQRKTLKQSALSCVVQVHDPI